MARRIILAGVLGGIAMFIWASIAHMALPLARIGIQEIPNEQALLTSMTQTLGNAPGFYIFPFMGTGSDAMKVYEQKLTTSPSGLLVYHPPGGHGMTPGQLITEFATELIEALLLALLLAVSRLQSFAARMGFVVILGLVASISTNVSYWNWYGFPASYTASYMLMQFVGYLAAGAVAARVLKKKWSA